MCEQQLSAVVQAYVGRVVQRLSPSCRVCTQVSLCWRHTDENARQVLSDKQWLEGPSKRAETSPAVLVCTAASLRLLLLCGPPPPKVMGRLRRTRDSRIVSRRSQTFSQTPCTPHSSSLQRWELRLSPTAAEMWAYVLGHVAVYCQDVSASKQYGRDHDIAHGTYLPL